MRRQGQYEKNIGEGVRALEGVGEELKGGAVKGLFMGYVGYVEYFVYDLYIISSARELRVNILSVISNASGGVNSDLAALENS